MQTKDNAHFHIVLVKGWVEKDGKFLLAKRAATELHMPGVWSLPGGKIDKGNEKVQPHIVEKTLKREIKEEVGIDIEDEVGLVYTSSFTRVDSAHVVNLTFLCRYKAGEAKALEETAEVRWFSLDELQNFAEAPDFLKREVNALMRYLKDHR